MKSFFALSLIALATSDVRAQEDTTVCNVKPTARDVFRYLSVVADATCSKSGVGCVTNTCRYCRLSNDELYSNLLMCAAIPGFIGGVFDPLDVVDTGPAFNLKCTSSVSLGDASVGIQIVTDVSCVIGGIGCMSDLCRFCKVWTTPQSANFINCSSVSTNNGDDIIFTPITAVPVDTTGTVVGASTTPTLSTILVSSLTNAPPTFPPTATTIAPVPTTTSAPVATTQAPTPTTVAPVPTTTKPPPSPTTIAPSPTTAPTSAPISTTSPPISTAASPTPAPTTTRPPPAPTTAAPPAPADVCVAFVSSGDQAAGISGMTDSTCRSGGLGCFSSTCRFCKTAETPQASYLFPCVASTIAPTPTTLAPIPTTVAPVPTTTRPPLAPTTLAPAPTTLPPTAPPAVADPCVALVSSGDQAVGISGKTDSKCRTGGLGCFSSICRFCKTVNTPQSSYLNPCTTSTPVPTTPAPVPTTTKPPPPPTTPAPVPTTVVPAPTNRDACAATVSSGDNNVGISAYTDLTCQSGGLGCFGTTCRFCKTFNSIQSQQFLPCRTA